MVSARSIEDLVEAGNPMTEIEKEKLAVWKELLVRLGVIYTDGTLQYLFRRKFRFFFGLVCEIRGHATPHIGVELIDGMILECPRCTHDIVIGD